MDSVHDIAAFILARGEPMTAMKLQKLVYYSQAWAVTLLGEPLFPEKVEAWAHGPVVYDLFKAHRSKYVVGPSWPYGDAQSIRGERKRLVDAVLAHYGRMTAVELSDLTHQEEPWKESRAGAADVARSRAEISTEAMRRYYSRQSRIL